MTEKGTHFQCLKKDHTIKNVRDVSNVLNDIKLDLIAMWPEL